MTGSWADLFSDPDLKKLAGCWERSVLYTEKQHLIAKSTWPRLGNLWKVSPWWFLWWIFGSIVPFVLSVAVRFFQLQSSSSQDLATPVNLPLAVSFTDTDPTAGSYGGVVTWAARSVAPELSRWSDYGNPFLTIKKLFNAIHTSNPKYIRKFKQLFAVSALLLLNGCSSL